MVFFDESEIPYIFSTPSGRYHTLEIACIFDLLDCWIILSKTSRLSVQMRSYFWSVFYCIRTVFGLTELRKSPYSV